MEAREFTWKPDVNPKADLVISSIWEDDNGDPVADVGFYDCYQFSSCLRSYPLGKISIRYPRTASKATIDAPVKRRCVGGDIQNSTKRLVESKYFCGLVSYE
jgi:hypothetical protein